MAVSGAAPLGKELQHAASSKLGKGKTFISQTWGLSETTGSSTIMPWGERDETGSVSPLLPNMSLRLVDDDGKDVEEGKPGEVWMKGPVVTKGYYKNLQATKDSFVDGWFCTGDIAIWKNGLPYIVDRKKVCFLLLDWILLTQRRNSLSIKASRLHQLSLKASCSLIQRLWMQQ
jgi:long-subunit acyl-CoA synthetase (AMP-forming)